MLNLGGDIKEGGVNSLWLAILLGIMSINIMYAGLYSSYCKHHPYTHNYCYLRENRNEGFITEFGWSRKVKYSSNNF